MIINRRHFLLGSGAGLYAQPGSAIPIRVIDATNGRPTAARVRLLDAEGNEVVPAGHGPIASDAMEGDVRFQSRRFCYVDGAFEVPASALPLHYQVIKGFEYGITEGVLKGPGEIRLNRWSNLGRSHWRGGDIHIHNISPKTCHLEMEAEDLDVANILTSDFTTDQQEFEGKLNQNSTAGRLIYVSQEFRHNDLGHMCVLNLKRLIEPVKPMQHAHYPLHIRACDEARRQGGYVAWAHFPSWPGLECPLDVAFEKLDGLEILSVLDPAEFPIFVRQVVPELEAQDGLRLWYRFLNCGYRLAATAGTDKMTTFVTVGANRVYAQVDGDFNYGNWIRALKAGHTFVTNSPVITCTVNGQAPGSTLQVNARGVLRIDASAESQLAYDRLEIVVNGQVIADATPSRERHRATIRTEYKPAKSCWVAARVIEDRKSYRADFRKIHVESGTRHGDLYGTRRPETVFAHTSPVYVIRDGKDIRNWDDARYYALYLETARAWLEKEGRFARPADKKATLEAFEQGKAIYEKRAGEARQ
jgi:hypothetical protein